MGGPEISDVEDHPQESRKKAQGLPHSIESSRSVQSVPIWNRRNVDSVPFWNDWRANGFAWRAFC